jgi:DNA-binding CsgD family transcriptional regulator
MRWGRYAEARSRLDNALTLAETYGYPRYREYSQVSHMLLDWVTGRWSGLADRATERSENENSLPLHRLEASLVIGLLLAADGQSAEAEAIFRRVLDQIRGLGAVESLTDVAAVLARQDLAAGRIEDALRVTEEPIGVVALKDAWLWASDLAPVRVEALVAAGRFDDAANLVAAFGGGVRGRVAPAPDAALWLCEGILAAGRGAPACAAAAFLRAADAWDALPRPYDASLARERGAHCLIAAGRREKGLRLLEEAYRRLSDLGARAAAGRVLDSLKSHGAHAGGAGDTELRRRGRPSYGDRLSPRELEVVRLVVGGHTNRQIAEALMVSRQTVTSHVGSAMRKLRVSSRTALAVSAVRLGLADDESIPRDDE